MPFYNAERKFLPTQRSTITFALQLLLIIVCATNLAILVVIDLHFSEQPGSSIKTSKHSNYYIHDDSPVPSSDHFSSFSKSIHIIQLNRSCNWLSSETQFITIATQATLDKLGYLPLLLDRWDGPVTLALFLPEAVSDVNKLFKQMVGTITKHSPCFKKKLTCHVTILVSIPKSTTSVNEIAQLSTEFRNTWFSLQQKQQLINCSTTACRCYSSAVVQSLPSSSFNTRIPYPINTLRNLAITAVTTSHVLLLDVDVVPSRQLATAVKQAQNQLSNRFRQLRQFPDSSSSTKLAFILPAFELQTKEATIFNSSEIPATKQKLMEAVKQGRARPFYAELNPRVQRATNYVKWYRFEPENIGLLTGFLGSKTSFSSNQNGLQVYPVEQWGQKSLQFYPVQWEDPFEPFVVASVSQLPVFDERFVEYGVNRLSQLCEMHVSDWLFVVLGSNFVVHIGFKTPSTGFTAAVKVKELRRNQRLYVQFKREMIEKYPNFTNVC